MRIMKGISRFSLAIILGIITQTNCVGKEIQNPIERQTGIVYTSPKSATFESGNWSQCNGIQNGNVLITGGHCGVSLGDTLFYPHPEGNDFRNNEAIKPTRIFYEKSSPDDDFNSLVPDLAILQLPEEHEVDTIPIGGFPEIGEKVTVFGYDLMPNSNGLPLSPVTFEGVANISSYSGLYALLEMEPDLRRQIESFPDWGGISIAPVLYEGRLIGTIKGIANPGVNSDGIGNYLVMFCLDRFGTVRPDVYGNLLLR